MHLRVGHAKERDIPSSDSSELDGSGRDCAQATDAKAFAVNVVFSTTDNTHNGDDADCWHVDTSRN